MSLLRQANCISIYTNPSNPEEFICETITMSPIWSGATAGSVRNFDIQSYINEHPDELKREIHPWKSLVSESDLAAARAKIAAA